MLCIISCTDAVCKRRCWQHRAVCSHCLRISEGRLSPRCSHLHPENAAVSTKVRYAGCYRSIGSLRWRSALGRSCWSGRDRLTGLLRCG
jgi:hypothetical protein